MEPATSPPDWKLEWYYFGDLITVEAASIETKRRRLQVALDGEVVFLESPLEYRVKPGALRVYVPAAASACYPHPFG